MKLDDNGTAFYLEGEGEKSNILNFKLFKTFVDLLFKMQIYLGMHIFPINLMLPIENTY